MKLNEVKLTEAVESIVKSVETQSFLIETQERIEKKARSEAVAFVLELASKAPVNREAAFEIAARLAEKLVGEQTPIEAPWTSKQIDKIVCAWNEQAYG